MCCIYGYVKQPECFIFSLLQSHHSLASENLFLRKPLALFQERHVKPYRTNDATRWDVVAWSRWFGWRDALVVVQPDPLIRWQRQRFRLFWRKKSRPPGRPGLPKDLQQLIRTMVADNITWGEKKIANELKLKLGIRVAPSAVRKYLGRDRRPDPDPRQRWLTFIRNHAQAIVAADLFTVATARFHILNVFVMMELGWGIGDDPVAFFGICSDAATATAPCRTLMQRVISSCAPPTRRRRKGKVMSWCRLRSISSVYCLFPQAFIPDSCPQAEVVLVKFPPPGSPSCDNILASRIQQD